MAKVYREIDIKTVEQPTTRLMENVSIDLWGSLRLVKVDSARHSACAVYTSS